MAALKRDAARQDDLRDVLEQQLTAAAAAAAAASGRESVLVTQLQAAKQQAETAAQQHSQRVQTNYSLATSLTRWETGAVSERRVLTGSRVKG